MPTTIGQSGALSVPAGSTATITGPDFQNPGARGVKVFVNTTAIGTGSITVSIQAKDPGSQTYATLLASAAIVTNVMTVLTVYPGAVVSANVSANDVLPYVWRIVCTANNANASTYSVGFSTLL